ncbi:uncharacterized protein EV420DRAFT_1708713 [Desarmillaria tabescens]|uniref:Uncharacterized protein n=1 Tax=Armillaria tabescens TaxID=1929756 RepID=A0AA39MWF2_ARMTA|nr:uncharacterized protein EV420DRAFT_1708713 [Desarmillaria tabescens]KAK0449102.1 hypothetical protein EV420DRAFT_1708713 [Desarmillaria tabescens]
MLITQPFPTVPLLPLLELRALLKPTQFPLDKYLSSEDNHIPPILRNAPSHLRSWLLNIINEEDKSWVQEHYKEVIEAMPVRLELWENNIILQIPSQIHQFAGRVIQRAMDKYESGTHSLTLMETADVPLSDKHWKQLWIGIALNIGKGQMPVLTVSVFWFGLDLMSEEKVAEERIESGQVYGRYERHWVPVTYQDQRRYNHFLAIGPETIEKNGERGKPVYYCVKKDSWVITEDKHGPEQDIIIQEGYYKHAYKDYDAPALTIPADELWKALLKCKEVTGVLKSDMESYKNTGTTGEPNAEDSEPSERRQQWVVMEVDFDAPVPKKLKRSH